jgi:hypothetical protein
MSKRILVGKVTKDSATKHGIYISKPSVDVVDGSGNLTAKQNLIFDSSSSTVTRGGVAHQIADLTIASGANTASLTISPTISYIPFIIVSHISDLTISSTTYTVSQNMPMTQAGGGFSYWAYGTYRTNVTQTTVTIFTNSTANVSGNQLFKVLVLRNEAA